MSTSSQNHQGHRHSEQSHADAGNASMSVSSVDISISVADSSSDEEDIGSSNDHRGQLITNQHVLTCWLLLGGWVAQQQES